MKLASGIRSITDVASRRMCLGCGACAWYCADGRIQLVDVPGEGIRPIVQEGGCRDGCECLQVCPVVETRFPQVESKLNAEDSAANRSLRGWEPVVGIWEGHASDLEIRFAGSSGGVLTALGLYCLEQAGMHGVLHTGSDPDSPVHNRTRLSRTRADLLAATGSRYSPASICDGLGLVESAPAPCSIIGRPVEIAAVTNACRLRPTLASKIGLTLSFFCAETPSTQGTVDLLNQMGVVPEGLGDLRYRGRGWPGEFAPVRQGDTEPFARMSYRESWGFLQSYRPWSVQMWPDGTGELADISCGDPWYEEPDGRNPGFSLVVARTERGKQMVESAMRDGYLELKPAEAWKLAKSQQGLLDKKGSVWGRRLAMRLMGLPVTRFPGLDLWDCWCALPLSARFRSVVGTMRRVLQRRLYRPLRLDPAEGRPVGKPVGRWDGG